MESGFCRGRGRRFPPELRRGVLSEDGIYDLLQENDLLRRRLRVLSGSRKRKQDGV